jgi:hypothetical protein
VNTFLGIVPFAAAESLLIWSIWRSHRIAFLISFFVLMLACGGAVAYQGMSALFAIVGARAIVFGGTCVFLGGRAGVPHFISREGLRTIGLLLFFLGLTSLFIA